jgi:hypothetical protein
VVLVVVAAAALRIDFFYTKKEKNACQNPKCQHGNMDDICGIYPVYWFRLLFIGILTDKLTQGSSHSSFSLDFLERFLSRFSKTDIEKKTSSVHQKNKYFDTNLRWTRRKKIRNKFPLTQVLVVQELPYVLQ